jgi:hypothetical protein
VPKHALGEERIFGALAGDHAFAIGLTLVLAELAHAL